MKRREILGGVGSLLTVSGGCLEVRQAKQNTTPTNHGTDPELSTVSTPTPIQDESKRRDIDFRAIERRIHELANSERSEQEISKLTYDSRLAAIARHHSWDMFNRGYYNHKDPNGLGPGDRLEQANYNCRTYGENLWHSLPSKLDATPSDLSESEFAADYIAKIKSSKPHYENLLSPKFDREGVGVFVSKEGEFYATQLLCG